MRASSPILGFALVLGLSLVPFASARGGDGDPVPPQPPGDGMPGGAKPGGEPEPNDGADEPVSFVEEVNRAIEQGVLWLKAKPKVFPIRDEEAAHWGLVTADTVYGGGEFKGPGTLPAGPTALALYALLKCGVDPKDPVIAEGFTWLKSQHEITVMYDGLDGSGATWNHTQAASSYELSVMILALTAKYDHFKRTKNSAEAAKKGKLKIADKDDREWLETLVAALVERRGQPAENADPADRQGWRYNEPKIQISRGKGGTWSRPGSVPPNANQDLSSTQLAALALYSADRFGVKADAQVWFDVANFALAHQETEGPEQPRVGPAAAPDHARGFMYIPGSPDRTEGKATGSMTACGLATLLIARDVLCGNERTHKDWVEKGLDGTVSTAVADGMAWLDRHWSPFTNPESGGQPMYYLYSLERAMDIQGKKLVGKHLWYTEGAGQILNAQKKSRVTERLKKGTREVDAVYWETGMSHGPKDVLDTCFALLFLKRATQGLVPPAVVTGESGRPADNR